MYSFDGIHHWDNNGDVTEIPSCCLVAAGSVWALRVLDETGREARTQQNDSEQAVHCLVDIRQSESQPDWKWSWTWVVPVRKWLCRSQCPWTIHTYELRCCLRSTRCPPPFDEYPCCLHSIARAPLGYAHEQHIRQESNPSSKVWLWFVQFSIFLSPTPKILVGRKLFSWHC